MDDGWLGGRGVGPIVYPSQAQDLSSILRMLRTRCEGALGVEGGLQGLGGRLEGRLERAAHQLVGVSAVGFYRAAGDSFLTREGGLHRLGVLLPGFGATFYI